MKMHMPRLPSTGRRKVHSAGSTAFGVGGDRAFRDPERMVAPDQAFSAAMAKGPSAPAAPAAPPAVPGQATG